MINIVVGIVVIALGIFNLIIGTWYIAQDKKIFTVNFSSRVPNGNYTMISDPEKEIITFSQENRVFAIFKRVESDK